MAEVKITDLVSQETIDKIKELNTELQNALATYTSVARDLAKGLEIPVKGLEDLDKIQSLLTQKTKEATDAQQKLTNAATEQKKVIADTTNTISRELMERERRNKLIREEYADGEKVKDMVETVTETYGRQTQMLAKLDLQIKANKMSQNDLEKSYKAGAISEEAYLQKQGELLAKGRALSVEKGNLSNLMKMEEKLNYDNVGSYNSLSHQLEVLKKTYKELGEDQRGTEFGQEMERSIQDLDAHLKDMAADMGEFQRNVGNYAIAGQNGIVSTESLTAAMQQEAHTTQDLVDQTKILEEGRMMLDKNDSNYEQTLTALNAKLEENKRKLTDVSDIIGKEATSVAEAETQNKRLTEAIKQMDLKSDGAKERLEQMRAQIERNKNTIGETTGQNEKFADSMLSIIGVNANLGSSLQSLGSGGNFLDGLHSKTKAFGATLMGLLANPWVLAFLGIAGVAAGFKWWYDYNKGLEEASRQTENFTGATGQAADKVTADMQAIADRTGKGYTETISAANVLVQQFGLSWEEANEKMKDGLQAGADMGGNMIANIERFGPALRDAGVSADEFMAILAETRNGIFTEDGISSIMKAGARLKAMTNQTEASLEAVGISAKKMQSDLESGNISMLEAVQQVSARLKELPENSQEAGNIIKNVFGRTASEGGSLLLQSIADINTNLDEQKDKMGELGRINREQMEAQQKLNETLNAVFKMSGTSFEQMTTKAKTYVAQGLTAIIKGCVDIANWFIRMYNNSMVFRGACNAIGTAFNNVWEVAKMVFGNIVDIFKSTGTMLEGVFTLDWEKVKSGWTDGMNALKGNVETMVKNMASNTADAWNNTLNDNVQELSSTLMSDSTTNTSNGNGERNTSTSTSSASVVDESSTKEAGKAAQEQLKILLQLEEATIQAMKDSHDKQIALIKMKYKKQIEAIKGGSEEEQALRIQLVGQMESEIADYEKRYQSELTKTNLENRLAVVEEGSEEELDIRMKMLEDARDKEIEEAEKTGADVALIEQKYAKERENLLADFAAKRASDIQEEYATEQVARDAEYSDAVNALRKRYAEELSLAGGNASKREQLQEDLEKNLFTLSSKYSEDTAQATIDMIERILELENMSAEDRLKWEKQLSEAKIELSNKVTDNAVENAEKQRDADDKLKEKRKANARSWLETASEACSAINDLVSAIYDGQIDKLDEQIEANEEAGEAEQERISDLVEQNVITEEEGEARKRAAEAQTAKKNEELEKKKQQLQYKQAIWDKANSVAQIGINTAMAIMQTAASLGYPAAIPFVAIAAAMGAIQLATVLATPIPKYALGTPSHDGGPAVVGDGGRQEVVMYKGNAWLTPDTPTLVDLPRGASVIPSVEKFEQTHADGAMLQEIGKTPVIVNNDYHRLEDKMDKVIRQLSGLNRARMQKATADYMEMIKITHGL